MVFKILISSLLVWFAGESAEARQINCTAASGERQCMICNCYFEARGEPKSGKQLVSTSVLARVNSKGFPGDVCSVVWQKGQYSWTRDKIPNTINTSADGYAACVTESDYALRNMRSARAPTFYYAARGENKVAKPSYLNGMMKVGSAGHHDFFVPYKNPQKSSDIVNSIMTVIGSTWGRP